MKKLFSAFLAVVLVLSTLCLPTVASTESASFGSVAEGYIPAEGSVGVTDFAEITDAKGSYHLTADVTVDVTEIKSVTLYNDTFSGVFDGAGHKIVFTYGEGVTLKQTGSEGVLFKLLKNATVKNLTVENVEIAISGAGSQNGVLANRAQGTVNLENIAVLNTQFDINGSAAKNVGGYIGDVQGDVNAKDCVFQGVIAEGNQKCSAVGGFFGIVRKGEYTVNMENCHVLEGSAITGTAGAAGLVGTFDGTTGIITNCSSAADIAVLNYGGGAVCTVTTAGAAVEITNFANNGDLQAKHVGGVLSRTNNVTTIAVTNAINNGSLTGGNDGGTAGGVIGTITGAATMTVTNFHNNGTAQGFEKVTPSETANGAHVGAIIGLLNKDGATLTVSNATNSGVIGGDFTASKGVWIGKVAAGAASLANGFNFETDLSTAENRYVGAGADLVTFFNCEDFSADEIDYAGPKTPADFYGFTKVDVRLTTLADSGVRYTFQLDTNLLNALAAAGYDLELGSLFVAAADVDGEFTMEELALSGVVYSDMYGIVEKHITADETYAAALTNLSAANYATDYVCAGYINLMKDGELYTLYTAYDAENITNLKAVATDALADEANAAYADILNVFVAE